MGTLSETLRVAHLVGVADRIVGAALSAMRARPTHRWSLDELAGEAGSSRSVLAERFQKRVGSSPMPSLTQWRRRLGAHGRHGRDGARWTRKTNAQDPTRSST